MNKIPLIFYTQRRTDVSLIPEENKNGRKKKVFTHARVHTHKHCTFYFYNPNIFLYT